MQIEKEILQLISEIGESKISPSAYDTAWVAQTIELDKEMGEHALEWLRANQLPSGCWGTEEIHYNHDRAICTLAAILTLTQWGNKKDKLRVERARLGLGNAIKSLSADISGATVAFEMLAPALLKEAFECGAIQRKGDVNLISNYSRQKYDNKRRRADNLMALYLEGRKKLTKLPPKFVNRNYTMAFSAEMMGKDNIHLLDIDNLQEDNGSLGCSPSSTAYFALDVRHGDAAALTYLRTLASKEDSGGFPVVASFDLFEITWTLWNLALPEQPDSEIKELCIPYAERIKKAWDEKKGISFSVHYTPKDGDDTAIAYDVLNHYGYDVDISALLHYKQGNHFHCYETEADPSMSANIHALGALKKAGISKNDSTIQSIVSFLKDKQMFNSFWFDKWHASPYYATSHAVIVGAGYLPDNLLTGAINWLLATQRPNGSWGYYNVATAEETAYALQALLIWKRNGGKVPTQTLKQGLIWLQKHKEKPYEPLWICKTLYAPDTIIKATILSALLLGEELT